MAMVITGKVICNKFIECNNQSGCKHKEPHIHSIKMCDARSCKKFPDARCVEAALTNYLHKAVDNIDNAVDNITEGFHDHTVTYNHEFIRNETDIEWTKEMLQGDKMDSKILEGMTVSKAINETDAQFKSIDNMWQCNCGLTAKAQTALDTVQILDHDFRKFKKEYDLNKDDEHDEIKNMVYRFFEDKVRQGKESKTCEHGYGFDITNSKDETIHITDHEMIARLVSRMMSCQSRLESLESNVGKYAGGVNDCQNEKDNSIDDVTDGSMMYKGYRLDYLVELAEWSTKVYQWIASAPKEDNHAC
jgi:hypothetical protein